MCGIALDSSASFNRQAHDRTNRRDGPVRTVVWEGSGREARPFPDLSRPVLGARAEGNPCLGTCGFPLPWSPFVWYALTGGEGPT